jgi:hypothetical protein
VKEVKVRYGVKLITADGLRVTYGTLGEKMPVWGQEIRLPCAYAHPEGLSYYRDSLSMAASLGTHVTIERKYVMYNTESEWGIEGEATFHTHWLIYREEMWEVQELIKGLKEVRNAWQKMGDEDGTEEA